MTTERGLPRRFGGYVLTAHLGTDALGSVFRALRVSGERAFARLRILETEELSEDLVLDAIEESGEIHGFLKNPAIARDVVMDSVGGVPYIAWNEESGRTLDSLLARVRTTARRVPVEHALLISEKVATALDHAYNTTVDGERTLHGLVWPGFVSLSDDGETRLTGFGLAPGVLPSIGRPRLGAEVAPYLAPEERTSGQVGRSADVYAVGSILFELLTGRLPAPADPLGDVRAATKDPTSPLAPELGSILRLCLSPAETRYQSSGELRRELGKLLFSGPYAPSTFNLAFFLSGLFGPDIEAENRGRTEEASLDPGAVPELDALPRRSPSAGAPQKPAGQPRGGSPTAKKAAGKPGRTARRGSLPIVLGVIAAAAIAGGIWLVTRGAAPAPVPVVPTPRPSPVPLPTPTPEPPQASTNAMSEAQFKEEVARRLAQELKRLDQSRKAKPSKSAEPTPAPQDGSGSAGSGTRSEPTPTAAAAAAAGTATAPALRATPAPAPALEPTDAPSSPAPGGGSGEEIDTPPKILSVVKPTYPPFALRARIGGVVILRVLVGETGTPLDVEVITGVAGGLTESAITAVRRWKFAPARRNGVAVRAWTTVPIPFEP